MPRPTFQEFMALMQKEGADKSIRAIASSWRMEPPDHFFAVVVEALYKAWCDDPSRVGNLRAWAKQAALNTAKRERQSATRQQDVLVRYDTHEELDTLLTLGGSDSLPQCTPQSRLEAMEELAFIFRKIKSLCPSERAAIYNLLERLCGDKPEEHLSEAERKALQRARASLKEATELLHETALLPASMLVPAAVLPEELSARTEPHRPFRTVRYFNLVEPPSETTELLRRLRQLLGDM